MFKLFLNVSAWFCFDSAEVIRVVTILAELHKCLFTAQQSLDPHLEFKVGGMSVNANKEALMGFL